MFVAPATKDNASNLQFGPLQRDLNEFGSKVKIHSIIKRNPAIIAATTGDTNQLNTTVSKCDQSTESLPAVAKLAPIIAPTTVCVPLIGIPNIDDVIIMLTDAKLVPNIIVV